MIRVDSKNGDWEFNGDMIEVITDIGFAIFNATCGIATISDLSWNKAFEKLIVDLTIAVKSAHEEAENDTLG